MIVTLDGPAGAGKSSAARALAARLGWWYMDTGAMYRAVALAALDRGVPLTDGGLLATLAESLTIEFRDGRVLVDGHDVSETIRTEWVTVATRPVADEPRVREVMKHLQRRLAAGRDVVTEGRDQGSVVFPGADLKVYLTACAEERARRRHREELARGSTASLADVLAAQNRRDDGDRGRPVGAMRPADDAVLLETDGLSPEEVLDRLVLLVAEHRP
ncbi:MAG: (d)CMP kinase [Planctomycetota bacterium]|jgi:cytidylate kinase/pantoate ligase/cytidylate kinase|nr:MAG: (d)CMP kinase [Planctomycetota bacterium]